MPKVLGALVAALLWAPGSTAAAHAAVASAEPSATSSFYVYGSFVDGCGLGATTECPLYGYAASEAVPATGGMTILDFGAPCFEPDTETLGTQLFGSQSCTPDAALVILAQAWLRGFQQNPNRSASSSYVLVAGTSNSLTAADPGGALTVAEMSAHGQAWFTSVVSPLAGVAQNLASPVTVWAGDDIEESSDGNWYDGSTTSAWVDGYASASGVTKPCVPAKTGLMLDYGDYVPNQPGWSPAALYHVSWQAPPACPMPEIYHPANADEWQSLNLYALGAGLTPIQFAGVLSEDGAEGGLSRSGSWTSFRDATGQEVPYLSVIGLVGRIAAEVPSAPSAVTATPGPGLVMVAWSPPSWDGGAAVTSYTVTVYAGSKVAERVNVSGVPTPESALLPLPRGASYRFYVSATNRVGTGPLSLPTQGVTPGEPLFMGGVTRA